MNHRRTWRTIAAVALLLAALLAPAGSASAKPATCHKITGQVLMTYHSPDTIIMATGKTQTIATVFTMTPTTSYTRNGVATNLDGIHYLDTGYITYVAVYPSGALLACAVVMTGP